METTKNKYRSGLEEKVGELFTFLDIPFKYEFTKLKYTQPEVERTYNPDFDVLGVHVETKGRLTTADRKKMLLVTQQNRDKVIVMVFDRAAKKLYKGSPTTYACWCDKNNIRWLDLKQLKENIKCLSDLTPKEVPSVLKTAARKRMKQLKK